MRIVTLAMAAGALLAATQANAASVPVNRMTGATPNLIDQVAVRVYVHAGHRYCFYFGGWHGPGWYRCGFAHRRGFGWGGVYGWNDWGYAPAERHFGHRGGGVSVGTRIESGQTRARTQTRSRTTTGTAIERDSRSGTSGKMEMRGRSTTGTSGNVQTRSRSTTGSGAGANIQSGAKVQGGTSGGAAVRGGASGKATTGAGPQEQKKQ